MNLDAQNLSADGGGDRTDGGEGQDVAQQVAGESIVGAA